MDASLRAASGAAGDGVCRPGQDGGGPQRADAADDEVGLGADAQHRDGCPSGPPAAAGGRRSRRRRAATTAEPSCRAAGEPAEQGSPNRRNGHSPKTVQGDLGELTLATPRDRDGTFEPQLIAKHQRRVPGFDEKILALYAKGMTTRDIQEIVQRAVRRRGLAHADLGDHRRPRRGSDRLADAAARAGLADRVLRRHRGARPRRRTAACRSTRFTWLWA